MPARRSAVAVLTLLTGEVLLLRRAPYLRHFPDGDSLPGGKAEEGEDLLTALLREVKEETGFEFGPEDTVFLAGETAQASDGTSYDVEVYRIDLVARREPTLSTEHVGFSWTLPADALASAPLAGPMTRRILERVAYAA